ncbi:DUF1127 domain-containing protein [Dongia sp.]|uniref:DUF1127 domain-containing protein n=1 Tax=Dongia sp. TaxID=1977262 RepID=UPI0035B10CAD
MQLLSTLDLAFRRWQRYGEVRRELATYTERELADMGLSRSEIPQIAREAAALVRPADAAPAPAPRFAKIAHT